MGKQVISRAGGLPNFERMSAVPEACQFLFAVVLSDCNQSLRGPKDGQSCLWDWSLRELLIQKFM